MAWVKFKFVLLFLGAWFLNSCAVTTPSLVPEAQYGALVGTNCPGHSPYGITFSPEKLYWSYVEIASEWSDRGTLVTLTFVADGCFGMHKGGKCVKGKRSRETLDLIQETLDKEYIFQASDQTIEIMLPNGKKEKIIANVFASKLDLKMKDMWPIWDTRYMYKSQILVSRDKLNEFSLYFPEITVNGEIIKIPEIRFKKQTLDWVMPTINC